MNEYRFTYDERHILDALSRYRRQRKVYPWFIAVKAICFLGLAALLAIIVFAAIRPLRNQASGMPLLALIPGLFMFLLVLGPKIDYFFLKRRLKKSPFYDGQVEVSATESGVAIRTPKSQLTLSWAAFTQARRLADGFLVISEPGSVYWWPDVALIAGTTEDMGHLLHKNIASYDEADA